MLRQRFLLSAVPLRAARSSLIVICDPAALQHREQKATGSRLLLPQRTYPEGNGSANHFLRFGCPLSGLETVPMKQTQNCLPTFLAMPYNRGIRL